MQENVDKEQFNFFRELTAHADNSTRHRRMNILSTFRPFHARYTSLMPVNLSIPVYREEEVSLVASQG